MRWGLRPLDLVFGGAVLVFGFARILRAAFWLPLDPYSLVVGAASVVASSLIVLGTAAAVTLYRRAPAVALALVWFTAIVQVAAGLDTALVQLAVVLVAYGTSRYGSTRTVVASVASIPLAGIAVVVYAWFAGIGGVVQESGLRDLLGAIVSVAGLGVYDVSTGLAIGFVLVAALLGAPWALGLVLRFRERSRTAERERADAEADAERSQELADLTAQQARLARDVHDVVGHSLAVIVAQADSTRALPDDELDRIRSAVANIAETARKSLKDVRSVLSDEGPAAATNDDLDTLIEGVRSGGTDVALKTIGSARPLPPELEVVAYRTLQELLTNALKHGVTAEGIAVTLDWRPDELVVVVRNTTAETPGPGGGTGLDGARDRLAAVGGTVHTGPDGAEWVATAHIPVRREGASA
ncbi:signal transduction histidine kinase [Microbacteriaceae bacterium SG_E_30_P1]|uniref:histidine kinase n=1 Tax=Antiquaquibacter oligotrophicus TaxID=2880260 RepID=A0ABT6KRG6_9MICO|nr:histidine kinase [Antiquaquibacter oligotrophicus]MDH6182566.1 signal transduction histidine kinase [Antiquaquibacter oligotrophicus]UDF14467.1 histidine kinase [Antiquaquibacter oligotrophicus]